MMATDKKPSSVAGAKPVPMKLFASWEAEKKSPNCIPRLCTMKLNRLVILKPLDNDLSSVIIAVKMQNAKRLLRTNEIMLQPNGLLDTELDLSFSLQYPHYIKRDGNKLQILLQKRKKYMNKTNLGYKTLAIGQINMAQVLQRTIDKTLKLYSDLKENASLLAQLSILSMSSFPVDNVADGPRKTPHNSDQDRSPDVDNDTDDEYNDQEDSSNDDLSECEHTLIMEEDDLPRPRKPSRGQIRPDPRQQSRNFKQKFIAILKRFKTSDDEQVMDSEVDPDYGDPSVRQDHDIDDLINELENLSDSGPEMEVDTISVISTPKPRLKPFFQRNGCEQMDPSCRDYQITEDNQARKYDTENVVPRKALLDQLAVVMGPSDDHLPSNLLLVNSMEWQGQLIGQKLKDQMRLVCTCGDADVKATLNYLVNKIQKFCNSNSKSPSTVRIGVIGGDNYINSILRPFVDTFSAKSPDWQNYIRFLVIPFGTSCIGKYLGSLDATYNAMFLDSAWKESFEKPEMSKLDSQELCNRVSKYLNTASSLIQIPISEAMVMCKGQSSEDESIQMFIPFLSEVKVGNPDLLSTSVDIDDVNTVASSPSLSSSPPSSSVFLEKPKDSQTPPNSPSVNVSLASSQSASSNSATPPLAHELMELQVDYWTQPQKPDSSSSKKESSKSSIKTTFRSLHVQRQPHLGLHGSDGPLFIMSVVTREKKQKIMRIGKKAKDAEPKSQIMEGINRMLCTSKSSSYSLKVSIDGAEWTGVKFFQLSSQWQTHVKNFPVLIFGDSL